MAWVCVLCAAASVYVLLGPRIPAARLAQLGTVKPEALPWADVLRWWRGRRRIEKVWRAAVIDLCDGLAAELTAGSAPEEALERATAFLDPSISHKLADIGDATDIPAELELAALTSGAEGLRLLAACWRIGVERGGSFASVADGLSSALREEETHRQQVSAQLAGARATAKLLAVLPLLGIGMAAALGARPLTFLCTTLPGLVCLLVGVTLDATGIYWTRRIATSAES
ncbi:MAG: type II secretion system F family protein [Streptosporangiaceae bacterium]